MQHRQRVIVVMLLQVDHRENAPGKCELGIYLKGPQLLDDSLVLLPVIKQNFTQLRVNDGRKRVGFLCLADFAYGLIEAYLGD